MRSGDQVVASVVDPEVEDGQALLSLRRAAKDRGWDDVKKLFEEGKTIEVTPHDANRGGLLVELEGVRGFLPVSQLSAEQYPRVGSSDKDEILQRLHALTSQTLKVRILDADRKTNKLIFSEKEAVREDMQARFEKLSVGDKVGDAVSAKIIAIDKDRLSLSMKQTQEDPWAKEASAFNKGDAVDGTVTRITPFGAFIQLSPSVEALVHISELGEGQGADPEKLFTLNEKKKFKVLDIDRDNRKISLSLQ